MTSPVTAPTLSDRLAAVHRVDWNFSDARSPQSIHNIHPYPAKFIPQIPRELIRLLHPESSTVILDPFCGSGTTLVEAQAAGHRAVGIDLNPLATLIARVKTSPPSRAILPIASDVATAAARRRLPIPPIPRLDHWFEPQVQQALANLTGAISEIHDVTLREALQVALSRIIVRVSNQESDTRYAAVQKCVSTEDVYRLFKGAAAQVDRALAAEFNSLFRKRSPHITVITGDILTIAPGDIPGQVGLVITSPPYPNAYEYWLYHKYRMYWLGFDPIPVRAKEIGARPHYFKKNPQTEADFEQQMTRVFSLLSAVMRPDALGCFVVGRSLIHGRTIDNAALFERAATSHGFRILLAIERAIPSVRKAFNPSHGSINQEFVLIVGR